VNIAVNGVAAPGWQALSTSDGSSLVDRHETGSVVVDGQLYVIGGRGNRPMQRFNPQTNTWTDLGAAPIQLHHVQPVHLNGLIYVIAAMTGGFPAEPSVDTIYTYDIAAASWSTAGTMPADRVRGGAAAFVRNDRIYLIGGNTNGHSGGAVPWFDEYDPATGVWQELPDAPNARDHFQAVLTGGRYLTLGGGRLSDFPDTFSQTVAATNVYDFNSGSWNVAADIPTPRAGTMSVGVGDEVWVLGGEIGSSGSALDTVESFRPNDGTWRNRPSMINGRHSGAVGLLGDLLHVVGGSSSRGGGGEFDEHETYDTSN